MTWIRQHQRSTLLGALSVTLILLGPSAAGVPAKPDEDVVAFGRIGDALTYHISWLERSNREQEPTNRVGSFDLRLFIGPIVQVEDEFGRLRRALPVDFAMDLSAFELGFVEGTEYVDLYDRSTIVVHGVEHGRRDSLTERMSVERKIFGPFVGLLPMYSRGVEYGFQFLHEFQGETLRVGTARVQEPVPAPARQVAPHDGFDSVERYHPLEPVGFGYLRNDVDRAERLDELDTVVVERTLEAKYISNSMYPPYRVPKTYHLDSTTWIAPAIPYPARIVGTLDGPLEEHLSNTMEGWRALGNYDFTFSLTRFERGAALIPWGEAVERPSEGPLVLERGAAYHPTDGPNSTWSVPLARALQALREAPAVAVFAPWNVPHPDAQLIGLDYFGSLGENDNTDWWLLFCSPSNVDAPDGGIAVALGFVPTSGELAAVRSHILRAPFCPSKEGGNSLTLQSLTERWETVSGDSRPPNRLRWGMEWYPMPLGDRAYGSPSDLTQLWIGHHGYPADGPSWNHSFAKIDIGTGAALAVDTWGGSRALTPAEQADSANTLPRLGSRAASHQFFLPAPADVTLIPAGPVVAAAAILVILALFKILGWTPFYARIAKHQVLDNKGRGLIIEVIRQNPALSAREVYRRVHAGWSTIVYHLGVLERNGLVRSVRTGRHRRYFALDVPRSNYEVLLVLTNQRTRRVLDEVRETPGLKQVELAGRVDVSPRGLKWHLDRLQRSGLIIRNRDGTKVRVYPSRPTETG